MTDKNYLVSIIQSAVGGRSTYWAGLIADALIAYGVTLQQWIPVTERLPEYDVKVLVCNSENGDLHTATLDDEIWHLDGGWLLDVDDFTHWMPKPILPKDGDT